MRKRRWAVLAVAVCILLLVSVAAPILLQLPVIGRVYGAEHEYLGIGGVVYERTADSGYTSLDRGIYIGAVKNETITMRVFAVKGDQERSTLFALWDWEGSFYVRRSDQ